MAFVSLPHIYEGEHHEDEALQEHDKDMEDCPYRTGQDMADAKTQACTIKTGPCAPKQGDQHEYEFAGKHVAEQPHAERNRLRGILDEVHEQVGRRQEQGTNAVTDRKSTRLNSSHVKISYAVFCLKKKK